MPTEAREIPPPQSRPSAVGRSAADGRERLMAFAALAALVFASRAWLAQAWGSALPFMDEWDVEAVSLYRPWLDGSLHWIDLFKSHNEHRLLLTRLVDLGFFVAFDRWEPWAQIILNAALHAITAAGLAALFWPSLAPRGRTGLSLGLAVIFTATCGWQNALLGIQTQVYFSSLFAVVALAGLILAREWSLTWCLGLFVAISALFCFAGGMLAALAALATSLLLPPGERRRKTTWLAYAILGVVVATGLLSFVEPPGQVPLHAQSLAQFYAVFTRCLGWPHVNSPVLWTVMQFPLAVLLVVRWRQRTPLSSLERFAVALVIFSVLQAAAVARNRAGGLIDARPLSRYQDPLLLGAAAQWFAALCMARDFGRTGRLLALAWSAAAAVGLVTLTTANLSFNLPYKRTQDAASLAQVREYLSTHDAAVFTRDPRFPGPHPNPKVVQQVLDDPILRPFLPRLFFSDHPESAPGMKPWLIAHGRAIFLGSLAVFAFVLGWVQRRSLQRSS